MTYTLLRKFITRSVFGSSAEAAAKAHTNLDALCRDLETATARAEKLEVEVGWLRDAIDAAADDDCGCESDPTHGLGPCASCICRGARSQIRARTVPVAEWRRFRKLPVVISATRFFFDKKQWPEGVVLPKHVQKTVAKAAWIATLEGGHIVSDGDWIIEGVNGEKYPCKDDIFRQTYESVD